MPTRSILDRLSEGEVLLMDWAALVPSSSAAE